LINSKLKINFFFINKYRNKKTSIKEAFYLFVEVVELGPVTLLPKQDALVI
tara:strand:- start:17 stop:169 length:153 start_codon:yes stop_codon:yes gene_type:complete